MKKALVIILSVVLGLAVIFLGFAAVNAISEVSMNKYIDSFATVQIEDQLTPTVDGDGAPYFVTDGEFRILQLTDVHIGGGIFSRGEDKKAINAVAAMITAEKPDLVVVTGSVYQRYDQQRLRPQDVHPPYGKTRRLLDGELRKPRLRVL